jgi:hypothetical protein
MAVHCGTMKNRGSYTHRAGKAEDPRSRTEYVESPAKLVKDFEATLQRKKRELAEQGEHIRRMAAIRRGTARNPETAS